MMKHIGTPRPPSQNRFRHWLWIGPLLILLGIGGYFAFQRWSSSASAQALETWIVQQGFDLPRPRGADDAPGTVLFVQGKTDFVAVASNDLLGKHLEYLSAGKKREVELKLSARGSGSAGANDRKLSIKPSGEGSAHAATDGDATLTLHGVRTVTLPLERVRDLTATQDRVQQALQRSPDALFIVTDALIADSVEVSFQQAAESESEVKARIADVQGRLGLTFGTAGSGRITSSGPVVLGMRLARLLFASTALGGHSTRIDVAPMGSAALAHFRSQTAPRLSPLWSGYDVRALVVGLGNYPSRSPRVGGTLPGALAAAELVAADLQRLMPADGVAHVTVYTSEPGVTNGFDQTNRRRRGDITETIENWVKDTKTKADPLRKTLVVFYYFGHGLADGMSRSVFLVPEAFVDDSTRRVDQLADRLVSVAWVLQQLNQVSDRVLMLVDACREHSSEDRQLERTFPGTPSQKSNLQDILTAIQFGNGMMGPNPVIFGAADGASAEVVSEPNENGTAVGPLAVRLHDEFIAIASSGERSTLADFVSRMTTPSTEANLHQSPVGYTSLTEDARKDLNDVVFLDPAPHDLERRSAAWLSPYQSVMSTAGVEPHWRIDSPPVASRTLCELDQDDINSMAVDRTHDRVYAADEGWRVYSCSLRGGRPVRVDADSGGGWLPVIATDRSGRLLGYSPDERKFFALEKRRFAPLGHDAMTKVTGESYSGDPVAFGFMTTTPKSGTFLRYHDGTWSPAQYAVPSNDEILGLAEPAKDVLYYTTPQGLWRAIDRSAGSQIAPMAWQPTALTFDTGGTVYILSANGRALYRISQAGAVEWTDLGGGGLADEYVTDMHVLALASDHRRALFIGIGRWIVSVDLASLAWSPLERSPS